MWLRIISGVWVGWLGASIRRSPGYRSLLFATGDALAREAGQRGLNTLLRDPHLLSRIEWIDPRWRQRKYWVALYRSAPEYTLVYLLKALDLQYDLDGRIVAVHEDRALYRGVFARTIWICTWVTSFTFLLGFPIAHLLARLPMAQSNLLLLLMLLPLWTSLLVKTLSWLVALGNEGMVNDAVRALGFEPLELAYNRNATYIAMVHILVPFMAFPLYAVMRNIDEYHMKAAAIMGATPIKAFLRVYLPQTMPGVAGGVFLVFILSLGLYVPPAIVGGPRDQMLGYYIAYNVNGGLSGALALMLLTLVSIFFAIYQRYIGIGSIWFK